MLYPKYLISRRSKCKYFLSCFCRKSSLDNARDYFGRLRQVDKLISVACIATLLVSENELM